MISFQMMRKKYGVRIPYSVLLLIVGGFLGYATWKNEEDDFGLNEEQLTRY